MKPSKQHENIGLRARSHLSPPPLATTMSLIKIKARSLGRLELLSWLNKFLQADVSKIDVSIPASTTVRTALLACAT